MLLGLGLIIMRRIVVQKRHLVPVGRFRTAVEEVVHLRLLRQRGRVAHSGGGGEVLVLGGGDKFRSAKC